MMPSHHPTDEHLLDYATGALPLPPSLLVATHLALCPLCRDEVEAMEAIGGAVLETGEPAALSEGLLPRVLARLEKEAEARPSGTPPAPPVGEPPLPRPLRDIVGGDLARLHWRGPGGIAQAPLLPDVRGFSTKLMRISAGRKIPRHTHEGMELTLVLSGAFSDQAGHYERGDVAVANPSVDHSPVADPGETCLCLAVTDAPLRLTGPFGRFLNRWLRL